MEEQRLQKYLAEAGIASRRKCEEYILQGRVKVNGKEVNKLGTKVNPDIDKIEFDDKLVKKQSKTHTYILLNKPIDYVTTVKDQFHRSTVLDLVKINKRLVPVGRLDMYTSGALILTDDGDFVYKITHPKHEINKTYTVTLKGIVTKEEHSTGMGLYLSKKVCDRLGLQLQIQSKENEYTRLVITFPKSKLHNIDG